MTLYKYKIGQSEPKIEVYIGNENSNLIYHPVILK